MRIPVIGCLMLALGSFSGAAFAHHSFASFDMKKEVRISGTVGEIQYTNPHAWLFVDVPTAKGGTESWGIELGSQNLLIRGGWLADTVKVGMKVVVTMHPMLDTSKRGGSLISIVLPNGRVIRG